MRLLLPSVLVALLAVTHADANVIGADAQNFNPTTSGLDFVTVQSSETLKPGIVNLGLFLNYAVNTLPYLDSNSQGRLKFNDSLLGLDLNAGFGLTQGWDIGVSLPQVLSQSVQDQAGARGEFASTGATEIRLNSKVRLYGDDRGGIALVGSMNFNRIQDNPYAGRDAGPTVNIEAAADRTVGYVALGANIGYRLRSPGTRIPASSVEPLNDQIIASAAASYHVPQLSTKFISEIYGSLPAQSSNTNSERSLSSAEFLVGAKHDLTTNLALHAGFATELAEGLASPDWRVYTGLNYAFGPVFESVIKRSTPEARAEEQLLLVLPPEGVFERFRTQKILFAFDSDTMVGNYTKVLEELASYLKAGFRELIIEGHSDSVGAAAYNEKLSLTRANAIKRHLVSLHSIDARKIIPMGYGETRPIADNGNYQGRRQNRRVDFQIKR